MRKANVTRQPDTDEDFPWNVAFYDTEGFDGDPWDCYIESRGAQTHAEAMAIADRYVHYNYWK